MKASDLLKANNREEADLLDKLDLKQLPQHLAVIMDGNGRWAQRRHLPRVAGHRAGVKAAREIIETSARLKLPCLTLYAFSLENWRRPQAEVDFLMRLLREYLKRELPSIHKNNIRLLIDRPLRTTPRRSPQRHRSRHAPYRQKHRHETSSGPELRRPRRTG